MLFVTDFDTFCSQQSRVESYSKHNLTPNDLLRAVGHFNDANSIREGGFAGPIGVDHLDGAIDEVHFLPSVGEVLLGLLIGELKDLQAIRVGSVRSFSGRIIIDGHILMSIRRLDIAIGERNSGRSIGESFLRRTVAVRNDTFALR